MEQIEQTAAAKTRKRYEGVNAAWPAIVPELTPHEALKAAQRLRKYAYKLYGLKRKARPMKLTSGRRYSYVRNGIFYVNPEPKHNRGGWDNLVHDISHHVHGIVHPDHSGHDTRHEWLERELREFVIRSGWFDGRLKRAEKPKAKPQDVRYKRVLARLAQWESKRKRAETALKKLKRQKAYYETKLA